MFLRSLSTISRTVFGKRYLPGEWVSTNKFKTNFAAIASAQFSSYQGFDDSDDESPRRPTQRNFDERQPTRFGGSQRKINFNSSPNKTFYSADVNRSRDFRYNFDKKYKETPDWKPFEKNFYKPLDIIHPKVDIDGFLSKHKITVRGSAPQPILSFDEVCLPDYIAEKLKKKDFTNPTPIQSQSWPIALSGQNLVGVAQTGSGKTLGYILPAIVHIKHQEALKRGEGPIALVLAPTRELAQQIQQVADEFGVTANVRNACVFGGAGKVPQAHALQRGR